ncbi:hypothetical protein AKJ16_DCAP09677 [Drosera capensis]
MCLCLKIGFITQKAILYCQKTVFVCNSSIQRLSEEMFSFRFPELKQRHLMLRSSASGQQEMIETLGNLARELEMKAVACFKPKSILSGHSRIRWPSKGWGKSDTLSFS